MDMSAIYSKLENLMCNLSLDSLVYSESLINEVFSLDVKNLDSIDETLLSKYIVALSQYLVFFDFELNKLKVKYSLNKKVFDDALFKRTSKIKGGTLTEKKRIVLEEHDALKEMDEKVVEIKSQMTLLEGLHDSIENLIFSLKRELTRRGSERQLSK